MSDPTIMAGHRALAAGTHPPVRTLVTHGELQAVILACQTINPDLARGALRSDATVRDLVVLLRDLSFDPTETSTRRPRGSYRTENATLRPIQDQDFFALYRASLDPRLNHRWRFRGETPSPDEFRAALFHPNNLAQFIVVSNDDEATGIGLVTAYNVDHSAGYCYLAFQRFLDDNDATSGLMVEGFLIMCQYLFDHFRLNKLYLEVPAYNRTLFSSAADALLVEEGRLRDHHYYGDRYWDQYIYAIYRDRWDEVAAPFRGAWPEDHHAT